MSRILLFTSQFNGEVLCKQVNSCAKPVHMFLQEHIWHFLLTSFVAECKVFLQEHMSKPAELQPRVNSLLASMCCYRNVRLCAKRHLKCSCENTSSGFHTQSTRSVPAGTLWKTLDYSVAKCNSPPRSTTFTNLSASLSIVSLRSCKIFSTSD